MSEKLQTGLRNLTRGRGGGEYTNRGPGPRLGVLKVLPAGVTPEMGCEGGEGHGI